MNENGWKFAAAVRIMKEIECALKVFHFIFDTGNLNDFVFNASFNLNVVFEEGGIHFFEMLERRHC